MIISRLSGGLGNQLFQYAYGRALSLRSGSPLKLDIDGLVRSAKGDTPRPYLLSHFNIQAEIATIDEIRRLKYPLGIVSKGWRYASTKILRKFNVGFEPGLFARYARRAAKGGDIYLYGFWQTERYFEGAEDAVRADLTLKDPFGPAAAGIFAKINSAKRDGFMTISLHVRRGDVARDAMKNLYFGISTPEYYARAFDYLKSRFSQLSIKPMVFVFSDDIEWAKQNISMPYPATYVEGAGIADYEDLVLMSSCDHHIIANSSFSWWGAWLDVSPNKIVIAPKEWIRKKRRQHRDTVPSSWIRV